MALSVDPITISVVQHRLRAVVEEMGEVMLRTSYSQILNSSRDFSTAICDASGRLIAQAEHVPIHVGALPFAAKAVSAFFGDDINPGDVFLLNDPYSGGSHLPDLTALVPVFDGDGHLFWSINRSHQSDIGGATHGAYNADATEIWQEGLRVPPIKLYDRGSRRDDIYEMLVLNVRHARDFRGDLAAMIGSARVGERRLLRLMEEFGAAATQTAIELILDGTEQQVRSIISTWKDGVYKGEAFLDDDGHGAQDIGIRATITKRGSELEVDLTDSDPQATSFINSSYANTQSAVVVAAAFLLDPDTLRNDGAFRAIKVKLKQGTVVCPNPGAPVTLCTSHCGQEIIEAIIRALAPVCPDRAMAGWGRRFRIAIQGVDPRTSGPFIWHLFHARPGGGASPAGDGWPGAGEWHSAGGVKFGSMEVQEARFPLYFRRHEFRTDSGGDGRHRGGVGAELELRLEATVPALANTAGDGARHGACGLLGGKDGKPHHYWLESAGQPVRDLKTKETHIKINPGDVMHIRAGGGGGWGDPGTRSAQERREDEVEGYVSRERAGVSDRN